MADDPARVADVRNEELATLDQSNECCCATLGILSQIGADGVVEVHQGRSKQCRNGLGRALADIALEGLGETVLAVMTKR